MKRTLENLIQMAEIGGQISEPIMVDKTVWFRPRDKDGKQAIMEGDYPDEFGLFVQFFKTCETNSEIDHVSWYKDKKDPRLLVVLRTRL
jgi:hypothetical protein